MTLLLIATALFGLVLGRFFKVFVLIPICGFAFVVAFAGPTFGYRAVGASALDLALFVASLQISYFAALAWKNFRSGTMWPDPLQSSQAIHSP